MEVRVHLEALAVRLACERRELSDLARLEAILDRTDETLSTGGNIVALDTEFHIALVDATHNSVLVRVLNAFYCLTARRRQVVFDDRSHARASAREHRKLTDCVRLRDAVKAEALIVRHMARARSYWSSRLRSVAPSAKPDPVG
jgi:DNA-binding FadR family transcriptional regulator